MKAARQDRYFYRNFSVYFEEIGEGSPLILLHPLGGSTRLWGHNVEALSQTHRVFLIDLLGCGKSDRPDISYDLQELSEVVVELLNHQKLERAAFVGNSMGGHLSLLLAANYPDRVEKIVLANPSGSKLFGHPWISTSVLSAARMMNRMSWRSPRTWVHMVLGALHGTGKEAVKEVAEFYASQMEDEGRVLWERAFLRTLANIFSTPVDELMSEIDCPTLIVWGTKDRLLGKSGGRKLVKSIPRAQLIEFPHVGHFPQIEAPEDFNRAVLKFLSDSMPAKTRLA